MIELESLVGPIQIERCASVKKKIALVWDHESPFWKPASMEAQNTSKVLNFDINIFAPKHRGEEGIREMLTILEEIRNEHYDGICISPITDQRIQQSLKKLAIDGVKVIFILSTLPEVPYATLIGTNNQICGHHAAKVVRKLLNNSGTTSIIRWKSGEINEKAVNRK